MGNKSETCGSCGAAYDPAAGHTCPDFSDGSEETPGGADSAAASPSARPVADSAGLAQGADSLTAEAQRALEGAGVDAGSAAALTSPDAGWKQITPAVVDVACIVVLPQWNIVKDERALVSDSLSECLEQVFPGGLEGKYACWVKLIFAVGGIAAARAMQPGGMPPLFQNKPKRSAPAAPATSARDPDSLTSLTPDA